MIYMNNYIFINYVKLKDIYTSVQNKNIHIYLSNNYHDHYTYIII